MGKIKTYAVTTSSSILNRHLKDDHNITPQGKKADTRWKWWDQH